MQENIYEVDGIEFTKRQYNVLKDIRRLGEIPFSQIDAYFTSREQRLAIKFLETHNFIEQPVLIYAETGRAENHYDKYVITDKGETACDLIAQHKHEFIRHLMLTKVSDIIVAFITALITGLNATSIWNFISELFSG